MAVEPLNAVYRAAVPCPGHWVTDEAMVVGAPKRWYWHRLGRDGMAQALWRLFRCVCQWLDGTRCAPPAGWIAASS
jgi:hypothetical protein